MRGFQFPFAQRGPVVDLATKRSENKIRAAREVLRSTWAGGPSLPRHALSDAIYEAQRLLTEALGE